MSEEKPVTGQPTSSDPQGQRSTEVPKDSDRGLPPGLNDLAKLNQVLIHQHLDKAEAFLCWQRPCRYSVYGKQEDEDHFLYIQEVSECYLRQFLGASRGFVMKFSNNESQDVLKLNRPLRCPCGICWWWCCCVQELSIESPPGTEIASITENRICCPRYYITDQNDDIMFVVEFSCCLCKLCSDVSIQICDYRDGEAIAEITKSSKGNTSDCCGTENDFIITFVRPDLHVQDKIIILGASFLIDYSFFERQQRTCC